jgi:hypothetical protein
MLLANCNGRRARGRRVISMIRNILVIKDGVPVVNECFGQCHTIKKNDLLITGFIDALTNFSEQLFGSAVKEVKLEKYAILVRRNSSKGVVTVFILDSDAELESEKKKMERAVKLFDELFGREADSFHGRDTAQFGTFRYLLLNEKIAEKNCGKNENCEDCPNCNNVGEYLAKLRKFKKTLSMPRRYQMQISS